MDQQIINLYDEYTHKPLSRSEFLRKLAILAGGTAAAMTLLPLLEVNYANAATTNSEELFTERIVYSGINGDMQAYVARPKENKPYATVVVIHENRGLNAHIEDVTRRAAKAGYLAIAPNALSSLGGTPENEDEARTKFQQLKADDSLQNFIKVFDYGRQPAADEVSKIKAAIQMHYGGLDERVNAGIPAYEEALKKNNIPYEVYIYEGANHAFHNDTAPTRYNKEAAELAWKRTLDFFAKYLK